MHELKSLMYKFLGEHGPNLDARRPDVETVVREFVEFCLKPDKPPRTVVPPGPLMYPKGDAIIHRDGKFHVTVMIQDGTENCGNYDTEDEARQVWCDAQKALNNNNFAKHEAPEPIYVEPVYRITKGYGPRNSS